MSSILALLKKKKHSNENTVPKGTGSTIHLNSNTGKNLEPNDSAKAGSFFISGRAAEKIHAIRGGALELQTSDLEPQIPNFKSQTINPWGPVTVSGLTVVNPTTPFQRIKNFFMKTKFLPIALLVAFSFLFTSAAFSQATVTTDKPDYFPGDTVKISGTGWLPGETVQLHLDETPARCPNGHNLYAVADSNGNIYNQQFLIQEFHRGVLFNMTATGQSSNLVAETWFTDATISSTASGDWNAAATWAAVSRTGTIAYTNGSTAIVGTGTSFTTELAIGSIIITSGGGAMTGTVASITDNTHLTLTTTASATQSGKSYTAQVVPFSGDAVVIANGNVVTLDAINTCLSLTLNTTGNNTTSQLTIGTGTLNVTNNVILTTVNSGSNRNTKILLTNSSSNLNIGGSLTLGSGIAGASGTGTLDLSNGGANPATNLAIAGNMTRVSDGIFTAGGGTVSFNGAFTQLISGSSPTDFFGLKINNANGVALNSNVTVSGTLDLTSGVFTTFAGPTNRLTMGNGSSITRSSGTITVSGTLQTGANYNVSYTGNSKTTGPELSGSGLNNVTVNLTSGQTLTLSQSKTIQGDLSVSSGTFDLNTFSFDQSASGTLTLSNGASLKIGGTNSFPSNYATTSLGPTSTVEYSGSAQTVASKAYGNLILSGSGIKSFSGASTIASNLSISSGVKANLGTGLTHLAHTLTLAGIGTSSGSWGSTISSATHKKDTYFDVTANGIVNVSTSSCTAVSITTCASGSNTNANSNCQASVPDYTSSVITAGTCGSITVTQSPAAGTLVSKGETTVTITATDFSGNTATCSAVFTVNDNIAPTIGSAGNNATINCPAAPTFTAPTASDNCGPTTINLISDVTTAGACANTYAETKTWDATDASGNHSGTVSQTITVRDNTPPTIGGQGTNATINCPNTPTFTAPTASDACSGAIVHQLSDVTNAGTCSGTYTRTISWDATDDCGNHSITVSQTITVRDNTPPTIGGQGTNATIDCPNTPTFTAPTASDVCSGAIVHQLSDITTAGTCSGTYTRTISWDATDDCGNHSITVSQTITVRDNTPPAIGGQGADATIDCPNTPSFTAPTASDGCSGTIVHQLSDVTNAGTCSGTYRRTVSWDATDACGNHSATVSQTITVRDITPPVIDITAANATIECNGSGVAGQIVNFLSTHGGASAHDACNSVSWSNDYNASHIVGGCGNTGHVLVVFTVTDDCGNASTMSATFTVADTTPPTISGQGASTTIDCPSTPNFTAPTASDACSGATVHQLTDVTSAGTCTGTYTRTMSWDATDACGNHSATLSQAITVRDNTPPSIGGQGSNTTINCPATPDFAEPTVSDGCGGATLVLVNDVTNAGTCANTYTETKTWKAVDGCGNESNTVSQSITVRDNTPPSIGGQGSNTTINCPATPDFTEPTVSDGCGGATLILVSDVTAAGTCANTYTETKTWKAVDGCGNESNTVSQSIKVRDITPPVIDIAAANATVECNGSGVAGQIASFLSTHGGASAHDACNSVSWSNDYTASHIVAGCGNTGHVLLVFTATDDCGNASTTSATFTVLDTTPPTISGQGASTTIDCPNTPNFTAPTASDACGGATVHQLTDVTSAGTCTGTYTRTVSWDATDACGNHSATVSQTITVRDITPPVIDVTAANATVECNGSGVAGQIASFLSTHGGASAHDACNSVSWSNDYTAGHIVAGCGNTGHVLVVFTATDDCGNASTTSATFTVLDITAPTISGQGASTTIDCPNTPNFTAPTASDACSGATVHQLTDVTSAGTCTSTYTRTVSWDATDACGNHSATVSQTITVRDITPPVIDVTAANATVECNGSGVAGQIASFLSTHGGASAHDACNSVSWSNDYTAGHIVAGCGNTGHVLVVFTATDDCGNVSTTFATFTVVDTTPPTISGQGASATIDCPNTPNFTAPTASDACSGATVHQLTDVTSAGTCTGTYTRTVSWDATDACGNHSATVSQTITVRDNTPPAIDVTAANATVECNGSGVAGQIASFLSTHGGASAHDACNSVSWSNDYTAGHIVAGCGNTGHVLVVFTATDDCGNASTTSATFTVVDTTPPTIGGQGASTTIDCPNTPNFTAPTASDACSGATVHQLTDVTSTGTCTGTYTRTVSWDATDACGNHSATVSQTITVRDITPPVIDVTAANATVECNGSGVAGQISNFLSTHGGASAHDACNSVTWSNDYNASHIVAGCGNTGHVLVVFTATDNCGNSSTTSATFTVLDTTPPTISGQGASTTINCPATPYFTAPTANDACSGATVHQLTDVTGAGTCTGTYTRTVSWDATDACGNHSATVSQTITVRDITPPVIDVTAANATVECNGSGVAGQIANFLSTHGGASAHDACNSVTWSNDYTAGHIVAGCGNTGHVLVVFTATDNCGNASTTSATFTVADTTPPVITSSITCNSTVNYDYNPSDCGTKVSYTNSANDDCSGSATLVKTAGLPSGSVFPLGSTVVTYVATDACGNTSSCSFTIKVNPAVTTSSLTITPVTQQYSDTVKFCAKITNAVGGASCANAADSVVFYVGTQMVGKAKMIVSGSDLIGTLFAPLVETPSYPSNGQMAPGNHSVTASFTGISPAYTVNSPSPASITITKEDADADYTGEQFKATPCATCVTQTINLSANILDITAVSPLLDNAPGDIRNAKVKFVNRDNNTDISGWIPVTTLVNPSDKKVGSVSYPMTVTLGSTEDYRFITVGIVVDNGYYIRDNSDDNTIVTVYKPNGDFITGGGYIIPTNSVGTMASDPGKKTNFGFNVKFNKTGKSLQGNMNIIFRRTESDNIVHLYQIKANSMISLGVNAANPNRQTAEYVSKTNITDITNPLSPVPLGGNKYLYVKMTDNGEPGTADSISFVLVDGTNDPTILNNIIYSSNWVANKTQQMRLSGGNLVVHSGFSLTPTVTNTTTKADITTDVPAAPAAPIDGLDVKAWPNPSEHYFTLNVQSNGLQTLVIRVYDMNGKQLQLLKGTTGQNIRFGEEYTAGTYFVEIMQGDKKKTIKLVKQ